VKKFAVVESLGNHFQFISLRGENFNLVIQQSYSILDQMYSSFQSDINLYTVPPPPFFFWLCHIIYIKIKKAKDKHLLEESSIYLV